MKNIDILSKAIADDNAARLAQSPTPQITMDNKTVEAIAKKVAELLANRTEDDLLDETKTLVTETKSETLEPVEAESVSEPNESEESENE